MNTDREKHETLRSHTRPDGDREEVDEGKPRVVDKRRFLRLLEEDLSTVEPVEEQPRYPSYVEELQNKLKASEARLLEYAEQVRQARQQMQSEVDAIRERLRRTMADQLHQSKAQFIARLLDVLDNLKRAIEAGQQTRNVEGLLEGIRATAALFERHLEAEGVSIINPLGEPFDPRFHHVVETVPVEPERDGMVIEVLQPGYRLGEDTLIRPAQVRVGKARATAPDAAESPPPAEKKTTLA